MHLIRITPLLLALLTTGHLLNAQTNQVGTPWVGEPGITETMDEIIARDRSVAGEAGVIHSKRALVPEDTGEGIPLASRHFARSHGHGTPSPLSPQTVSPTVNFTAATTGDCSGYPPDTMGAAGPS